MGLLRAFYFCQVNVKDNGGSTPLHYACKCGDINTINYLM